MFCSWDNKFRLLAGLLGALALVAAAQAPRFRSDIPPGLDLYMPVPESNPITPEKVALGRRLFFDRVLSRDEKVACATCHDPARAFTDGRETSVGVFGRKGPRNVPTLVNRAYGAAFFWDGRASGLEEQVVKPIQDSSEMDLTLAEAVARLQRQRPYRKLFRKAFERDVNAEDLARALASYVRTILSGEAPVDRYTSGQQEALSPEARLGLSLFRGRANCTSCHVGPNFTDEKFHNTGIAWREPARGALDPGRANVTGKEEDRGAFKTPTLREISRTAPYMHDGSLATLSDVVEFYNRGGNPNPHLDPEIRPLQLTPEEKQALLAFLNSLSGQIRESRTVRR